MFAAAGLDQCNPAQGTLNLNVPFSDGSSFTYTFTPDRENIMSYWHTSCRGIPPHISDDQIFPVRSAMDAGGRTHLTEARQLYSAVFEPGNNSETRAVGWGFTDFVTRFDQEIAAGKHLVHMQAYDAGGGVLWDGVWDAGSNGTTRAIGWNLTDFATRFNQEIAAGKHLVHMQAYDLGGEIRYDGVWETGARGTTRAIGWNQADFTTRFDQEIAAGKHLVHMQAYDIGGGQIRYDGVWETGARGTTRAIALTQTDFATRSGQEIAAGKHVVHMQAYAVGGQLRWDGVWETGNNGTVVAIGQVFNDLVLQNEQQQGAGKRLVHFQPYDKGNGQILYDGAWETSATVQTHIFAETLTKFAEGFDAQLTAGRHAVQMRSIRAGQAHTASTDLFVHNGATGQTQRWVMRTTQRLGFANLDASLDRPDSTGWRLVGARDLDQDGDRDILVHNATTGAFQAWYMNGGAFAGSADFSSDLNVPDSMGWSVVGLADFNGDGKVDILFHNGASGGTQVWYMNGVSRTGFDNFDPALNVFDSSGWRAVGTGDFDQDGHADLVWHNGVTGQTQVWFMNGINRVGATDLELYLDFADLTGWSIVGVEDVSFDGRPDIVAHDGVTGATQIWYMNGLIRVDYEYFDSSLDFADNSDWRFVIPR